MSIELFKHNQTAYDTAVSMLEEFGKAAVIHPTGTGKSFIAFKLCEDNPHKRICWLSPSEYIFKTQLENLLKTAPDFQYHNITFITYSKLMIMNPGEIDDLRPEYIILDEFHRCGAAEWGKGVELLLERYPKAPILGLSATAIRYLDNQRNMADELFDGNIASEMTLGEAIVRGILSKPTYVISIYSYQKELEKYESKIKLSKYKSVRAKAEKYLDTLRRTLEMADGIDRMFAKHMRDKSGKYIVFCANIEHLNEMTALAPEWFDRVDPDAHIYKTYADNPEASTAFRDFKADSSSHLKLLYCVDMLNEGIHVEDVSGVILLRPTVSPIIYKQQIGRALSASGKSEPIIFDIVNNFENLYSISAIEEEMQVAMTYYRYLGESREIVNDHFEIVDVLRDCSEIFHELEDTLTISWDMMYLQAKAYYQARGNLEVPRRYKTAEGYSLGNWIATQRQVYNGTIYGELSTERVEMLTAIGMRWDSLSDNSWERLYTEAKKYHEKHGNLNTNINYISESGFPLGKRICQLRSYRKSNIKISYITPQRIALLDELGMIWNVPDYVWEENYSAALEYYREHGNLDIPVSFVAANGVKAGVWIRNLRSMRQSNSPSFNLTDYQIQKLDEIGMLWMGKYDRLWQAGYEEAKAYYEANGNLNVPNAYVTDTGYKLGAWISNQRESYQKMKPHRKELLDAIGMIWQKDDPWEVRFSLAEDYYKEHGDLKISQTYKPKGMWLGKWINEQKHIYHGKRKGKALSQDQITRLEGIGMVWV